MIELEEQLKEEVADLQQRLRQQEAALTEANALATVLAAQARQMNGVMEASRECVMVLDDQSVIRYLNSRAVKTLGGGSSLLGKRLQDVYPAFASSIFWEKFNQVLLDCQPITFEEVYSARQQYFVINITPVGDGIALFFHDITERKRHDAMLQKTEKLAAVGRLASSISHEINNPLESVVNLLYLIEHSESAGDDMRTYASLATSELARVSHIVTHTLKFHRQSTRASECSMSEILESVLSLYQGKLATQKVAIVRKYAQEDRVLCFAGDMRQVFANFVGNALDAMRGEGRLTLRTRCSKHWKSGARGLRILIADTGCGMSESTRQRIFEAFFTTKMTTGTGLGLWVSEEIIRNHKGTVGVKSSEKPGRSGTVFSIFFPLSSHQDTPPLKAS